MNIIGAGNETIGHFLNAEARVRY